MEKNDAVDRKINAFFQLIDWFFKDSIRVIALISIISNIYLVSKLIDTTKEMSKEIVTEVRKQVKPAVEEQVDVKVAPMKTKVDNLVEKVSNAIDSNISNNE